MKYWFAAFLLLTTLKVSLAQSTYSFRIYSLEEARKVDKDSVFGLQITKRKLTEIPSEIYQYKHLKYLDLSKNKLTSIPQEINQFKQLELLNVGKNRLTLCPIVICSIPTLKVLKLYQNPMTSIPECIQYLTELEELDLFETLIESFPGTLVELKKLKLLDAQGILYGKNFQENWRLLLPDTKILFDLPCNCLED